MKKIGPDPVKKWRTSLAIKHQSKYGASSLVRPARFISSQGVSAAGARLMR